MNSWSVVIPACILNEELREKFLKAYQSVGPWAGEILVVENGSRELGKIASFQSDSMLGYARAVNEGLRLAKSEFVLILNSDAVMVTTDWNSRLTERFLSDENAGIVIPWIRNDGEPNYSAQIVGPCWAIRKKMLDTVGFLSEEYGEGYYDDSDYFMEARKNGWKILSEEGVKVDHAGASTFKAAYSQERIKEISSRNFDKYASKWHGKYPEFD